MDECKPLPGGEAEGRHVYGRDIRGLRRGAARPALLCRPAVLLFRHRAGGAGGRALHSSTSELNLKTFMNTSLTLELNLGTFGTHPRINFGHMGGKVILVERKGAN